MNDHSGATRTNEAGLRPDVDDKGAVVDKNVSTKDYRVRRLIEEAVNQYGLVFGFLLVIAIFSGLRPSAFPTNQNVITILTENASLTLISLGVMLPLIAQQFDLTPGYMATLAGLLAVGLQSFDQWPAWAAVLLALAVCGVVGLFSGLLVAKLKLNSLIVTLGVGSLLFGVAELYSNGATIFSGISPRFFELGQNRLVGIPLPFIYAAVVALIIAYFLRFRPSGRQLYAIGGSEEAARLVGVRVDRLVVSSFVFSALLSAAGGIVETARIGSANDVNLQSMLLPAFTAAFLGATVFRPGHYNVWGTVLAVYLVGTGTVGMYMLGASTYYAQIFDGGILLLAIALARLSSRRHR